MKRAQATGNTLIKATHRDIADELNSPREVITRLLNQLQERGRVTLARGAVEIHLADVPGDRSKEGLERSL